MKKRKKLIAIIIMLVFILPNAYTIIIGKETYPYTPAPMFGHYIGDETLFYKIKFIAKGPGGEKEVLPLHEEHQNALAISRFFFDKIYGSVEAKTPLGNFADETRGKFKSRMEQFCSVYFAHVKKEDPQVDRIDFVVDQFNRNYDLKNTHAIGYYDFLTHQFIHTWK